MMAKGHTDLLAMLPAQWGEFRMTRDTLQVVPTREVLPVPPIVCIRRPNLPLTTVAEFFLDPLLRHQAAERPARSRA